MSKLEIREKLAKISDSVTFDENGNIIIKPEKMGMFLTFAAYANRDLLEIQDNSKPFLNGHVQFIFADYLFLSEKYCSFAL